MHNTPTIDCAEIDRVRIDLRHHVSARIELRSLAEQYICRSRAALDTQQYALAEARALTAQRFAYLEGGGPIEWTAKALAVKARRKRAIASAS